MILVIVRFDALKKHGSWRVTEKLFFRSAKATEGLLHFLVSSIIRDCRVHFGAVFNKSKLSTEMDTGIYSSKDGSQGLPQNFYIKGVISLCQNREIATLSSGTSSHRLWTEGVSNQHGVGVGEYGGWDSSMNHEDMET